LQGRHAEAIRVFNSQRGIMKIGLFDHVEHDGRPLATLFDERLTFVKAADEAGIYCLHVAEHHATPLNMVPVPASISARWRAPPGACGLGRWCISCRSIRRCG
jgi:hypothetical protein